MPKPEIWRSYTFDRPGNYHIRVEGILDESLWFARKVNIYEIKSTIILYDDIVVKTPFGRMVADLLGLIGIIFTGLMVAAALRAVGESMKGMKKS